MTLEEQFSTLIVKANAARIEYENAWDKNVLVGSVTPIVGLLAKQKEAVFTAALVELGLFVQNCIHLIRLEPVQPESEDPKW